jgi:hypothetical protein
VHALASFKLRFHEVHVRVVPSVDPAGRPFAGPGVDLRGAEAEAVLDLAAPLRAWIDAREPGAALRSLSVDMKRGRVLLTLASITPIDPRPRVVRFDPPHSEELLASAPRLLAALASASLAKLRAREEGAPA